jgi:hypothetical protein
MADQLSTQTAVLGRLMLSSTNHRLASVNSTHERALAVPRNQKSTVPSR